MHPATQQKEPSAQTRRKGQWSAATGQISSSPVRMHSTHCADAQECQPGSVEHLASLLYHHHKEQRHASALDGVLSSRRHHIVSRRSGIPGSQKRIDSYTARRGSRWLWRLLSAHVRVLRWMDHVWQIPGLCLLEATRLHCRAVKEAGHHHCPADSTERTAIHVPAAAWYHHTLDPALTEQATCMGL